MRHIILFKIHTQKARFSTIDFIKVDFPDPFGPVNTTTDSGGVENKYFNSASS